MSPHREPGERSEALVAAAVRARSLEDVAELLRTLRRRHARTQRDSALTYRELAERTGWSQSAIAEYFTGRTLAPTDRFDALLEVLGAEPAELRALADARDRVEETQRRDKHRRPVRGSVGSAVLRQLPADTALFTGREDELGQLLELAESPVDGAAPGTVVISAIDGMGGVGKTALAVHAGHRLAERFPDGQLFLDLHGFAEDAAPRQPGEALAGLLGALGVPPAKIPEQVEARAAHYRERLAGTRTLVVLDNALDEGQVRPLLPASPGCLVLVTSRRRLKGLDDAVPLPLDVLSRPEAVALLRQASRVTGEPGDDAEWERIVELCGQLPLALVIAGALLRTGGKAWTRSRLIDRLSRRRSGDELAGYTDEVRDLGAVFDLSYQALPASERRLFRRIGLIPGAEIDAYAAAALLDTDLDTADLLVQRLADHSLLIGSSPGRYRVHDLIRAHASSVAASLDPELERVAARDRLLHFYAYAAQTATRSITRWPRSAPAGPPPAHIPDLTDADVARTWLRAELPNLQDAFTHAADHGLNQHTITLAMGVAEILRVDGPWTRALYIHHIAAQAAEHLERPTEHADALIDLGRVRQLTGDMQGADEAFSRALEIHRELDNRLGEANAVHGLGRMRQMTDDYPAAIDAYTRALDIFHALDNRLGEANTLNELGRARNATGNYPAAVDAHVRALEIHHELGNRLGEANALNEIGRVRHVAGDFPGAIEALSRALEIHRELGDRLGEANALTDLGSVRIVTGRYTAALAAHAEALEAFRALGNRLGEANTLNHLGDVRNMTGDHLGAIAAQIGALELYRALGNRLGEANALTDLGRARTTTGDHAAAVEALTTALEIYGALGSRDNEAWALNHYAAVLAASGRRSRALEIYRRALTMNRELDKPDDEAVSLEGIAEHYSAGGDKPRCVAHLRPALEIYRRLGMRVDADRVHARLEGLSSPGTEL